AGPRVRHHCFPDLARPGNPAAARAEKIPGLSYFPRQCRLRDRSLSAENGGKRIGKCRAFRFQPAQAPPLTSRVAPVMKPSYSLARYTAARATSAAVPARPSGMPAMVARAEASVVWVL